MTRVRRDFWTQKRLPASGVRGGRTNPLKPSLRIVILNEVPGVSAKRAPYRASGARGHSSLPRSPQIKDAESKDPEDISTAHAAERHSLKDLGNQR